jgi:hypothetical protein
MLLKIDVDSKDIIFNENGRIIIKVDHFGAFANVAHLVTTAGYTKNDFDKNKGKSNKTLFVGINGGLSLE